MSDPLSFRVRHRHPARHIPPVLLLLLLLVLPVGAKTAGPITRADGLPSDAVTTLAWDGEGLWIGTIAGLGRWENGRVRTVEVPLRDRHVRALHSTAGSLWLGTMSGVARYDGTAWQQWQRGEAGLRSSWITAFASHQGALYLGSYTGGVQRWTGEAWLPVGQSGPDSVTALASDGNNLWAGTPRGLWQWDGERWQRETFEGELAEPIASLTVNEGSVWAATEQLLAHRLAGDPGTWRRVAEGPSQALTPGPKGLLEAREGRIGRRQGAAWEPLAQQPPEGAVISALLFADDQLFAGTMGQGLWTAETAPAEEPPLPVILLHGLGDANEVEQSNMRFLATWLERDGHVVAMTPSDENRPLMENVSLLRRTIAAVREETGAAQLFLIGHSFGGLIGRAYLASGADDVAGLITLGSPHAGVHLAYDQVVSELDGTSAPSQRELLPEHAALLAPFNSSDHIPQLHVGGDLLPEGNLFDGFPPHDGIVTAASATRAAGATRVRPLLHGWTLKTMELGLPAMLWPDDLYLNTLRPWMQAVAAGAPPLDRAEAPALPDPGFTARPLLDRSLAPGESERVSVELDEQPATWLLDGGGVTMDLVAPDGTRYYYDRVVFGDRVAHLPYRESILQPLDIWSTRGNGGPWEAEVTNRSERHVRTRLRLVNPLATPLEIMIEEPWVDGQETVTVRASGMPDQTLRAIIGEETVPFVEEAPGEYRVQLTAPRRPGYHPLRVVGEQQERWAVVGVRSPAWQLLDAEIRRGTDGARFHLTLRGEGRPVLGLRVIAGEEVVATRLVGPFRYHIYGEHTINYPLPLPGERGSLQVEWQLFNSSGAITPVTPLQTLSIEP